MHILAAFLKTQRDIFKKKKLLKSSHLREKSVNLKERQEWEWIFLFESLIVF